MKKYEGWVNMPTIQTKEILNNLIDAKQEPMALLIISNTGLGKSHTIDQFMSKKEYANDTLLITVGDSFKLVDVVDAITEKLDVEARIRAKDTVRVKFSLIAARVRQLHKEGRKLMIILDEAENLKPQVLKMLKELYDAIIKYCSLVLIGTEYILDSLLNLRNKNRMSVPQLYRRFKAGIRYISKLDKARDFMPFFDRYIAQEKDLQDLLLKQADNYGELHDYLHKYLVYCTKKNEQPTAKSFCFYHKLPMVKKAA